MTPGLDNNQDQKLTGSYAELNVAKKDFVEVLTFVIFWFSCIWTFRLFYIWGVFSK
jgi:hypothetical protein